MVCRSACKTQNHASYGACARDAHLAVQWLGGTGPSYADEKAFGKENDYYAGARKAGLEPTAPTRAATDAAYQAASEG